MIKVNEKIAIEHGLKKDEYKKICELLKRTPNITELGIFSAMWNEHCSYKSSKIHYSLFNNWWYYRTHCMAFYKIKSWQRTQH